MSVYDWHDPFTALRDADWLRDRDYDYDREVDEMRHNMRERYAAENAHLRALNEHLIKRLSDFALQFAPPIFLRANPGITPDSGVKNIPLCPTVSDKNPGNSSDGG